MRMMDSRSLLFSEQVTPSRKRSRRQVVMDPVLQDLLEIAVLPDKDAYC